MEKFLFGKVQINFEAKKIISKNLLLLPFRAFCAALLYKGEKGKVIFFLFVPFQSGKRQRSIFESISVRFFCSFLSRKRWMNQCFLLFWYS